MELVPPWATPPAVSAVRGQLVVVPTILSLGLAVLQLRGPAVDRVLPVAVVAAKRDRGDAASPVRLHPLPRAGVDPSLLARPLQPKPFGNLLGVSSPESVTGSRWVSFLGLTPRPPRRGRGSGRRSHGRRRGGSGSVSGSYIASSRPAPWGGSGLAHRAGLTLLRRGPGRCSERREGVDLQLGDGDDRLRDLGPRGVWKAGGLVSPGMYSSTT